MLVFDTNQTVELHNFKLYINKILTLLYIQKYIYVISDYFNYLSNEIQIEN